MSSFCNLFIRRWKCIHRLNTEHINFIYIMKITLFPIILSSEGCSVCSHLLWFLSPFAIYHPLYSFPFICICSCHTSGRWLLIFCSLNHVVKSFLEENSYIEPKITTNSFHMKPFLCSFFFCLYVLPHNHMWSSFVSFLFHNNWWRKNTNTAHKTWCRKRK